jgi:hypothetical protein
MPQTWTRHNEPTKCQCSHNHWWHHYRIEFCTTCSKRRHWRQYCCHSSNKSRSRQSLPHKTPMQLQSLGGTISGVTSLAVQIPHLVLWSAPAAHLAAVAVLPVNQGGTGASDAATARTNLGLGSGATANVGTIATQDANAVTITGGTITGLSSALPVASGGTGGNTAAAARSALSAAASGNNSDITQISGLTTALSPVFGGTGQTTFTAGAVLLGAGNGPIATVAPGTSGNILRSNGSTWVSDNSFQMAGGTVTSVALAGGAGISVSGSPILSSGTITVTNTGITQITGPTVRSAQTGAITFTGSGVSQDRKRLYIQSA